MDIQIDVLMLNINGSYFFPVGVVNDGIGDGLHLELSESDKYRAGLAMDSNLFVELTNEHRARRFKYAYPYGKGVRITQEMQA